MSPLVVILDEDETMFDTLAKVLEDTGYLVLPLSTSDGIIDELKDTHAAALLLDLQSGGKANGIAVLTQIEQDADLASLSVLAYSSDDEQLRELAPRLHTRGYGVLQKPLDTPTLLSWLSEHLR